MLIALSATAFVGIFGIACFAFCRRVLSDVECERTDLARGASPCQREFRRLTP